MSFLIKGSVGLIDTSPGKTPMLCSFISEHRADILAWSLRELKDRYPNREDDELINGLSTCIDEAMAIAVESYSNESRANEQRERAEHLGSLAHEIRNALGNASMAFDLIRRGKAGIDGSTADVLQRALSRIADLVAETLTTAQDTGGVTAQREWIRLDTLLSQLVLETPSERNIRIQLEVENHLGIDAD